MLAHTGFAGAANFSSVWQGHLIHRDVTFRIQRISAQEIPEEGRERWLFGLWAEFDRWVTDRAKAP